MSLLGFCVLLRMRELYVSHSHLQKKTAWWSCLLLLCSTNLEFASFRSPSQPFPPCLQNLVLQTVYWPVITFLYQSSSSPPYKLVFETLKKKCIPSPLPMSFSAARARARVCVCCWCCCWHCVCIVCMYARERDQVYACIWPCIVRNCFACLLVIYIPLICMWVFAGCIFFYQV